MTARVKLEIVNFEKFKRDIVQAVSLEELPKIFRKIKPDLDQFISDAYVESFYRTDAIRGIIGDFAGLNDLDLEAQFGLLPGMGLIAAREMAFTISDVIDVAGLIVRKDGVSFNISFTNIVDQIRRNVTNASYDSNGFDITWLDWLLDGTSETLDYRIKFGFNKSSRSGRAIMIPGGTWSVQSLATTSRFGNFLIDALQDQIFQREVNNVIEDKIERAL